MSDQFQIRRDTAANIAAATPAQGELAMETDTDVLRIGDGATPGGVPIGVAAIHQGWIGGNFYVAGGLTTVQQFTMAANTLYAFPLLVPRKAPFTKMSANVQTAAGTNGRLGVYNHAPSTGLPGTLLLDAGNFSTASTGLKEISGLGLTLNPGLYWGACMTDGAPVLTGCQGFSPLWNLLLGFGEPSVPLTETAGFSVGQAFGAMPASYSGSPARIPSGNPVGPGIFFRL